MSRPKASIILEVVDLVRMTFNSLKRQKLLPAFSVAAVVILIAVFFAFLAFVQTISPFVYPLF